MTPTQCEIMENIRRDITRAEVPWASFQRVLAWVTLAKYIVDPAFKAEVDREAPHLLLLALMRWMGSP